MVLASAHNRTHDGKTGNVYKQMRISYDKTILNGERMSRFSEGAEEIVTTIGREH